MKDRCGAYIKCMCNLAILSLVLLATSCAAPVVEAPSQGRSAPSLALDAFGSQATAEDINLHLITSRQGIAMTAGGETPQGNYQLDPYPDGSADIIYFDYATAQCVRLSSDANVGHNEASTAYIPSCIGGARCLVAGEQLYVIKNGQPYSADIPGNDVAARLYCMNLDGSERKIREYGSGISFSWKSCVAADNKNDLYMMLNIVDREDIDKNEMALSVLGAGVEGYKVIQSWPAAQAVDLVGVYSSGFVVSIKDAQDGKAFYKLEKLSVEGDFEGTLLEWEGREITSYTIYDNILYFTKADSPNVFCVDILTRSVKPPVLTGKYPAFKGDSVYILCEVRDRHLMLQLDSSEQESSVRVAYDLQESVFSPMNLYVGEGDDRLFVGIFAEGSEDFLVNVGKFTRTRSAVGTDGTPYTFEQGFQDYVLISKQDYWENRPRYQAFGYYQ